MATNQLLAVAKLIAILAAPYIFWLALFATARQWSLNLRSTLPWIKALRWATWVAGMAMLLIHLAHKDFPLFHGISLTNISIGLLFPERWVRERFAPNSTHTTSPENWWPSKQQ